MKKIFISKPKRRNPTWTFQVAADVLELYSKLFPPGKKLNRGQKTALLNEALRKNLGKSANSLLERPFVDAEPTLKAVKNKPGGTH